MRWTLEKGPALTRYDPVPPYRLVYQGPRKLGGTYELHDHEAHWTLASARTQGKGTDHPLFEGMFGGPCAKCGCVGYTTGPGGDGGLEKGCGEE
jgi:hypothetical protein